MFFTNKKTQMGICIFLYVALLTFLFVRNKSLIVFLLRFELITISFLVIMTRLYVGREKFYNALFKNRLLIAIILFIIMTASNFNYSSVGAWDNFIQPGSGSILKKPIMGQPRMIRSDEWLVRLPGHMSAQYVNYGKINDIAMASDKDNLSVSGLLKDYSMICKPADIGFYFLGTERGEAFSWNFRYIFGFLIMFELFYIITNKNRLLGFFGASLISFSQFNMWWSTVEWIWTGAGALVCFYYLIENKEKWQKILFGIGTAIFFSNFIVTLYPAWQVPSGYIYLMILIWIIIKKRKNIKDMSMFDKVIILISIVFFISIISRYIINYRPYMKAIINTKYPGKRVSLGNEGLSKIFGGIYNLGLPFFTHANPSEASNFCAFFPLGIILSVIVIIKNKFKDTILLYLLLIPTTLFIYYIVFGLPKIIATATLMTMSMSKRTEDILGFVNILLIFVSVSYLQKIKFKAIEFLYLLPAIMLPIGYDLIVSIQRAKQTETNKLDILLMSIIGVSIFSVMFFIFINKLSSNSVIKYGAFTFIFIIIFAGLKVNPINYKLYAITSKPLYKKVRTIVKNDKDAKWISMSIQGDYLITAGAKTYNSTNHVPNFNVWKKLGIKNEKVYNRYAHVAAGFTNKKTFAELITADIIYLYLNKKDFSKLDITYVVSGYPLEEYGINCKKIYQENGAYIYKIQ